MLNCFACAWIPAIWHRLRLILTRPCFDLSLLIFNALNSFVMSSANAMNSQHEPMAKHTSGIVVLIIENTAIHSIHMAIKYPHDVLQLNGNLLNDKSIEQVTNQCNELTLSELTSTGTASRMIHRPYRKCSNWSRWVKERVKLAPAMLFSPK